MGKMFMFGCAALLIFAFSLVRADSIQSSISSETLIPQKTGVAEFATPDGRFDLDLARSKGFQGTMDLEGFNVQIDRATGEPVIGSSDNRSPADHPDDVYWSPLGSGLDNDIWALTVYDNKLIAGGHFTTAGGVAANYIAAWDGSSWSPLGSGMNDFVWALTVYDNKLIAGGFFTTAGGVAANYIAAWNGSSWSSLGSGMNDFVGVLTVYDNKLIAGGGFWTSGGAPGDFIAAWDGSSWSPLGSGMNSHVRALTVYDNKLIAGGYFTTAGGDAANNIAAWDGSSWSPLGSGMGGGSPYVYALTVYNNKLIAGGYFTTAGGVAANYIAAWDGSSWSPLGSGMNNTVFDLTVYDYTLIAGGYFGMSGGVAANYIAAWNWLSWSPLGSGMNNGVRALTGYDNKLIAGGLFTTAGGVPAMRIAAWDRSPFIVVNSNTYGPGSLRDAIDSANGIPGADTVRFVISDTIELTEPLPALVDDSTAILGSTAPGGAHTVILDGTAISGGGDGLVVQSRDNLIEGLTIRNFPGNGITVGGALSIRNRLTQNIIYNNNGLGIDLGADGVTTNDAGDIDTGPNTLLNHPVFDTINANPDSTFWIHGKATDSAIVEFYVAHPVNDPTRPEDPTAYGEAYSFIGADTCDADSLYSFLVPKTIAGFSRITSNATDTLGNTSEFGLNFTLIPSPLIIVAYSPVNLKVTDPNGFYIGKDADGNPMQTLFPATYTEITNDSVNVPNPLLGQYIIEVIPESDAPPGSTYGIGVRINGSVQSIMTWDAAIPSTGTTDTVNYGVEEGFQFVNGDPNDNGTVNILDVTFLISYLYKGGPAPYPVTAGDAQCNGVVNILDVTYLIGFLYKGGPPPCQAP